MPLLAQAYETKEQFYSIWNNSDRSDAEAAYLAWHAALSPEVRLAFQPLVTAMSNWHDEIFADFSAPGASITNATTEALNLHDFVRRVGKQHHFIPLKFYSSRKSSRISCVSLTTTTRCAILPYPDLPVS